MTPTLMLGAQTMARALGLSPQPLLLLGVEAGGADDMRAAAAGAARGIGERGLGRREFDHHLRGRDQDLDIVADDCADRIEAEQHAQILADRGVTRALDTAR